MAVRAPMSIDIGARTALFFFRPTMRRRRKIATIIQFAPPSGNAGFSAESACRDVGDWQEFIIRQFDFHFGVQARKRFRDEDCAEVSMPHRQFPSLLENDVFIDVFANPRRTGILKNFLNAVFASERVSLISDLSLSPRENNRLDPAGKLTIVDIKAVTDSGETIQIEVQVQLHKGLAKRILYTWAQLYGRTIVRGGAYHQLLPVRSIWILARDLFDDAQKFHSFTSTDAKTGTVLCPDQHIVTLELRKWGDLTMIESDLDCWAYLLGNTERIDPDNPPELLRRSSLEEAMAAMRTWTKEQLDGFQADKEFREEILYNTVMKEGMQKGIEQGIAQGLEQGLEQGRMKGFAEGIAEGEKLAKLSMVKDLIAMGIPIAKIAGLTGLPQEEIR